MNIQILSAFAFPVGLSGTNRIISYAKGLVELNNRLKVICIFPTENNKNPNNMINQGIFSGIEFKYLTKSTIWPNNYFLKIIKTIQSLSLLLFYIIRLRKEQVDLIIASYDSRIINLVIGIILKIKKVKFVFIVDEYPKYIRNNKQYLSLFHRFIESFSLKIFNGLISMTKVLITYYKPKMSSKIKILNLPMSVEPDRFEIDFQKIFDFDYIAYIGDLSNNKDGVEDLIEAFFYFNKAFPQIKLVIIGDTKNKNSMIRIKQKVQNKNLNNDIIFLGKIVRDDIPKYICNAKVLVLARPSSRRSEGGFPTKLGEYLMTGKPVLVTNVGEIGEYLIDNTNSFLVKPDDPMLFSQKLLEIFNDYSKALSIAKEGKKIAMKVFNYQVQAKILDKFLKDVLFDE